MNIESLKAEIESNKLTNNFIIFNCKNSPFLAEQYTKEISNILGLNTQYIDDLNMLSDNQLSIFEEENVSDNILYIYKTKEFNITDDSLTNISNLIIMADNTTKEAENIYNANIITLPKLENWQIKDYVHSNMEGVNPKFIDWLLENTNYDIYRLQSELDKFKIFESNERNILFQKMLDDNAFEDITKYTIWDFTDSIVKKDFSTLGSIYLDINNIDMEPMGVFSALYQNFRKLIMVWMNKNPIPDNTGLTTKQIYAINKLPRVWNADQLIAIFKFLTEIDFKIKTGQLPIEYLIDYLIINIMSR